MKSHQLISKIAKQATEEFYSPFPPNYKIGRTKYIVVAGSVMSGVGKGIFASSLAKLIKYYGFKIEPIKIDGYLNQDAGTLNPFRHGEVFVLDDGTECDMDLGSYERFLNTTLTKDNYLTAGMIFKRILEKERKGHYLGRDVQFIPHVTGEIKFSLRNLAVKSKADIVLLEVGGTVGDYENAYIIEAIRELIYEEGKQNVCFINVSYILEPQNLGEQKSKPAQLGLNRLLALGIQPDIIVCRAHKPVTQRIKEKISVYSNVPLRYVIGLHDIATVYEAPLLLKKQHVDNLVLEKLNLLRKAKRLKQATNLKKWHRFVKQYLNANKRITVAIAGKYTGLRDSYASILKAIEHAATACNARASVKFIETTNIRSIKDAANALKNVDALIIPGGFGKRGAEGKIACISYARRTKIPFLGLCFGFQLAVIEFARNKCHLKKANSTELDPKTKHPVICILPEQNLEKLGGTMRLGSYPAKLKPDTLVWRLYKKQTIIHERHRHRYEVNPEYVQLLENRGLIFSGTSPDGILMEFLELPQKEHPFFIATQSHPEFKSRPMQPAPLFFGLIKTALK